MDPMETLEALFDNHAPILMCGLLVLVVSCWLMQKAIGVFNLRAVTIPAVFFLTYLVMIFLPSFLVYSERSEPYRTTYIIAVLSLPIVLPLGILSANFLWKFNRSQLNRFFYSPIEEPKPDTAVFMAHALLTILAAGLALVYVLQIGTTPLEFLIRNPGNEPELTLMREQSFKLLDPRWETGSSTQLFYAYLFLRTLLFPFLIAATYGYYLHCRERKWLLLFIGALGIGGLYAASSIARAPLAAIFMRLFFVYYMMKSKLNRKVVFGFLLLIVSFPVLITAFAYGEETGLLIGLQRIALRFTYTPAMDLYYYFEIFPATHDYLYGHTLIKPVLKLFGADYFYIENYVHRYISPNAPESGHANAAFLSNLHADFGLAGVVIGGYLTGLIIQALQIYNCRQRKSIYNVSVYAFLVYAIWVLNFGSVTSVLFVNGMIPVLFLPAVFRLAAGFFKKISRAGPAVYATARPSPPAG